MRRQPVDAALLVAFLRALAQSARGRGALSIAIIIGGAMVESVGLVLLIPVLQLLTDREGLVSLWFAEWRHESLLLLLLAAFLLAMTARAFLLYARDRLLWRVENDFVDGQRARLMQGLASARWASLASVRHAEIQSVLSTEMIRLAMAVRLFVQIGVAALLVLVQGGLAIYVAPVLAGTLLAAVAAAGVAFSGLQRAGALGHDLARSSLNQMQAMGSLLSGLKAALAQNLQYRFLRDFRDTLGEARDNRRRFSERQARLRLVFGIGSAACACLVVAGGALVLEMPTPALILLVLICARLAGPVLNLQQAVQQFAYSLPSFAAVAALEAQMEAPAARAVETQRILPGAVELQAVHRLHGEGAGLAGVDLIIRPGERIAVTGASGAGKTTMLDVLAGLTAPDSGAVAVGGATLDVTALPAWRDSVAYVVQEPYLFRDSVRANVTADTSCDDAAIWSVLELVGADTLVRRLEGGLDTLIGEGGAVLSGGERQRLALGRAILRRPRLLMLDEATNALDLPSERRLLQHLFSLDPSPAVLMVTHRRENLDLFDRVLEMREGRLLPLG